MDPRDECDALGTGALVTIAIAEVVVGVGEVAIQLRDPGIIRCAGFRRHQRLISAQREPEFEEQLVLFVEADPKGPLRNRKILVLASNQGFSPKDGIGVEYLATARSELTESVAHIFEIKAS